MADIGFGALLLVLICTVYALLAFFIGVRRKYPELIRSGENGMKLAALWTVVASGILWYLLLSYQFQVEYVYAHVSTHMPLHYVLSAFWAGQEGSLLFWLLLTAIASMILLATIRDEAGMRLRPYLMGTLALVEGFMALVLIVPSNPFKLLPVVPSEGFGLNPLLENWGMIFHPPTLFVGYALYAVPFAFVIAGLLSGHPSDDWMARTRRWSLVAWLFLGIGIWLGAWWAYLELSWGGYWSWDPVENSSLMPWLIGTAALHSASMQHRRGIFRVWTAALNVLTFGLCIFATFVTRSGVIQSVHAFSRSVIGTYFILFLFAIMLFGLGLLWVRRRTLAADYPMESILSRESGFLLTNLLLVGGTVIVFLGTMYPALAELFVGRQIALDSSFFDRAFSPLGLALIILFAICPILGWKKTSASRLLRRLIPAFGSAVLVFVVCLIVGYTHPIALGGLTVLGFSGGSILAELFRTAWARHRSTGGNPVSAGLRALIADRRRYGGMIVHFSILLIVVAIVGSAAYKEESQVAMMPGEKVSMRSYELEYLQPIGERLPDKQRFAVQMNIYQDGRLAKQLIPEKNFHWNVEQWVTEVAVWSRPTEDLYVTLGSLQENGLATFQVIINPLMFWMWVGGGVMVLGALLSWWPEGRGAAPVLASGISRRGGRA